MNSSDQGPLQTPIPPSNLTPDPETKAGYADWWIGIRERLLNEVCEVREGDVQNGMKGEPAQMPEEDPATALKRALDAIEIAAIAEGGAQVDYAALRDSPSYQKFRREHTLYLKHFNPAGAVLFLAS